MGRSETVLTLSLCINQEQLLLSRDLRKSPQRAPTLIPVYHRITGPLDVKGLQAALQSVVDRHAALRTSFEYNPALSTEEIRRSLLEYSRTRIVKAGVFVQSIAVQSHVALPVRVATESTLPGLIKKELAQGLDQSRSPRLRASLFELAKDKHLLLIALDHLVSDGWSVRLIERDLYGAPRHDKPPSFADFAKWQNESFETQRFRRSIDFWRNRWEQFGDNRLRARDFPFTLSPSENRRPEYDAWEFTLDPAGSVEARRTAEEHRITLFMLFVAVWALVLKECTGKDRFPIWAHFNNRVRPETHEMFGYLINTHMVCLDLTRDTSGRELLDQVRRAVLEAAAHQEVPLPQCWRAIGVAPKFDDAFVLLDFHQGNVEGDPTNVTRARFPDIVTPRLSKLAIDVTDRGMAIDVSLVYAKNVFDPEAVRQVLEHFRQVLSALLANPATRISQLSAFRTS